MSGGHRYHERLLHWIWETYHFDLRGLKTVCGLPVSLIDPGRHNRSDGPDFLDATLRIGDMRWFGDLEFHWAEEEWKKHGHQSDPRYNRVILHLVYQEPGAHGVLRSDGTRPFTLHLKPYLSQGLDRLLAAFHRTGRLPCSGQLRYLSTEIFERQLELAHRKYFEQKTAAFLEHYNPSLPPFKAWQESLGICLFDGLGISLNREPMVETARRVCAALRRQTDPPDSSYALQELALSRSGLATSHTASLPDWHFRGCRPANRPRLRVSQGGAALWEIRQVSFRTWNRDDPATVWKDLIGRVNASAAGSIGRQRSGILFGTVLLPALWLLGNLFRNRTLKKRAYHLWLSHKAEIPQELLRPYEHTGIPSRLYRTRLGAVYQLREYCKPRRCDRCSVLKMIIYS